MERERDPALPLLSLSGLYYSSRTWGGEALVWVLEVGRGSRLRLRLRFLCCLPTRLTAVTHRRAEFLRPSPSVHTRSLRCVGRGGARGRVEWGGREE